MIESLKGTVSNQRMALPSLPLARIPLPSPLMSRFTPVPLTQRSAETGGATPDLRCVTKGLREAGVNGALAPNPSPGAFGVPAQLRP